MKWVIRIAIGLIMVVASLVTAVSCSSTFATRAYSAMLGDNKPYDTFELADGVHYVGSNGISSYAIETEQGLIVIDAGYSETVPIILNNLDQIGFSPSDVSLLLNTHSHMDHAAGLARLKRETGAQLAALPVAAEELARGGRDDFFLGNLMAFEPVATDITLADGDPIIWGDVQITPIATPGHTRGCTSFRFTAEIAGEQYRALLICSLSVLRFQLADNPEWPGIAEAFQSTFATLDDTPCELFLGVHGWLFDLDRKRDELPSNPEAFIDPDGCRSYISYAQRRFEDRLASQMD